MSQAQQPALEPLDTSGRVLKGWAPNEEGHWESKIAWRTLWVTTFSLLLAFCVWYLVSAIAPRLNEIGYDLTKGQLYWLTSMPGLAGGLMRLAYMFLPPIIGTRKMVGWSSLLFIIPAAGWFWAVQSPSTAYWILLLLSFLTGIGGGVFSGYMPSTGYFFPKSKSGTALGIQAGIGNFGVSLIQLLGPWVMGFGIIGAGVVVSTGDDSGHTLHVGTLPLLLVPWAIIAGLVAFATLKDVPIKANFKQQMDIFGNKNTWLMTLAYLMTFGAFSGFAAQFALIVNNTFGASSELANTAGIDPASLPKGAAIAFLPPLIASAVRVLWGPLCDRFGGAIWTFVCGVGMTICTAVAALFLKPTTTGEYMPFLIAMLALFFFAGMGNAATFKQMPMIFEPRQAGGVIGWTAAIAAFGPFLVGVALTAMSAQTFFIGCAVFFAITTVLVWIYYARPKAPFPG